MQEQILQLGDHVLNARCILSVAAEYLFSTQEDAAVRLDNVSVVIEKALQEIKEAEAAIYNMPA